MKVKVKLCPTLSTPTDCSPPGSSVHGFSRQEYWSGLPFPSPMHESENESEFAQSCPTLSDPMDCSPPGSSVHGFSRQEYWSGVPLPSPLLNTVTSFLALTCRQMNLFLWSVFCQLNSWTSAAEPKRREEKSFLSNSCSS